MAVKAHRPTWKGSLRLSLIAVPIQVFPATTSTADVSFRQLHRRCHTPIQLKKWCPHCKEEVGPDDIVRGYEAAKGEFVLVEDEEIAQVRPESTHTVDLSHLVDASAIQPIYVERTYYVTPETKAAGAAFVVIRQALEGHAAIGRLALHGREYLVAIQPFERALAMHTLRTAGEVRGLASVQGLEFTEGRPKADEVRLARQIFGSLKTTADLSSFTDRYEEALREIIARKSEGGVVTVGAAPAKGHVVNLMEALRRSLAEVNSRQKSAARPTGRPGARVLKHPSGARRARRAS